MNRDAVKQDLRTLETVLKKVASIQRALATINDRDGVKDAIDLVTRLEEAVEDLAADLEITLDEGRSV